jgi:hypothetical protein
VVLDIAKRAKSPPVSGWDLERYHTSPELNELREYLRGNYLAPIGVVGPPPTSAKHPPSPPTAGPTASPLTPAANPPHGLDLGKEIDSLATPDQATLLSLVRHPDWTEAVNGFCATPANCAKLATLVRHFVPHLADPAIEAAAIFVIFGNPNPRPAAVIRHFIDLLKPVADLVEADQIALVANVINLCMSAGADEDAVLGQLIPPFQARLVVLGETTFRRARATAIFRPEAVVNYFEISPAPRAFAIVKDFVVERLIANQLLRDNVSKQKTVQSKRLLDPILQASVKK